MKNTILQDEKKILLNFINLPIPVIIKDNAIDFKYDLMECYEELFNSSHSLIDGHLINKKDIFCIFDNDFNILLNFIANKYDLRTFCDCSCQVIEIIKKYSI